MRLGVVWPTVRPLVAVETVSRWRDCGYFPLLMMNREVNQRAFKDLCGIIVKDVYEGYFRECNLLCGLMFKAGADVVVCAGDYVLPDPNIKADDIALKFGEKLIHSVGQPFHERREPCWSPWVGRAFWASTYGGNGPFHFEYFQYAAGRELEAVAKKIGNYWETDVIHQHQRECPAKDYYREHNLKEYREKDLALFRFREENGFEGASNDSKLLLPPNAGRIILPNEI